MQPVERQTAILQQLEERGQASTLELAESLDISPVTVRRDLQILQRAGLLRRVHGGAVVFRSDQPPLATTHEEMILAETVYGMLHPGDTILLEGSSLAPLLAKKLTAAPLRLMLITNHLEAAYLLRASPAVEVILLGGRLHRSHTRPVQTGIGDLKLLVAGHAFVEADGMSTEFGASAAGMEEAHLKRDLLLHALQKTLVAPARRWGLVFPYRVSGFTGVDRLVTTRLPQGVRGTLIDLGVKVVEVSL